MDSIPTWGANGKIGARYRSATLNNMDSYLWAADKVRGKNVVDLGCGRGDGAMLMSFFAAHIVGIDNSVRQLEKAKRHDYFCKTQFIEMNIDVEIPSEEIEVVTCFQTLEHLKNPKRVIEEFRWKRFLFSVPHDDVHPLHLWVFRSIDDVWKIVPEGLDATITFERGIYLAELRK